MNCNQAYLWMLSAEAAEGPLPRGLRRHLLICRKCSKRRRRLLRLTWEVAQATPVVDDPAARARIAAAVRRTTAARAKPSRSSRRGWRLLPCTAAAGPCWDSGWRF